MAFTDIPTLVDWRGEGVLGEALDGQLVVSSEEAAGEHQEEHQEEQQGEGLGRRPRRFRVDLLPGLLTSPQ